MCQIKGRCLICSIQIRRNMERRFTFAMGTQNGRQVQMEVRQKNQQVTKRKVKTWTTQEDNRLLELYDQHPKKWNEIAGLMPQRNENQCLHRYRRLVQLGKSHKIWSSEEDETILKLIKKYGKNWKLISEMLGSKNGKQIRERFINKLDPCIKKEDWSEEEDQKILELYSKLGSRWSQISKHLPGRPENKVKNRFYSFIQKNYDIRIKEVENISPQPVPTQIKKEESLAPAPKMPSQQVMSFFGRGLSILENPMQGLVEQREDQSLSENKIVIPSIKLIDFEGKNESIVSHNFFESVVRVDEDYRQPYQSIIDFQSCDLFPKHMP